jgi:hypothetical protein
MKFYDNIDNMTEEEYARYIDELLINKWIL